MRGGPPCPLSCPPAGLASLSKLALPSNPPAGPTLLVLFFASGALGLVYEVLWMRWLTTLFGATTLATTATLSGFFLGLALGSLALGERSRRWRRPLLAFGLLEIGVGLGALLVHPILDLYRHVYPLVHVRLASFPAGFALVKLLLAVAAIGIPTFCMGGTLPALGQAVAPTGKRLGMPVGGLYAINLAGAALGTLAVPFVLLPRLGLGTTYVVRDLGKPDRWCRCCALVRLVIPRGGAPQSAPAAPPSVSVPLLVLALSFLSGLSTLALQTLWTRMFSLVHENSALFVRRRPCSCSSSVCRRSRPGAKGACGGAGRRGPCWAPPGALPASWSRPRRASSLP